MRDCLSAEGISRVQVPLKPLVSKKVVEEKKSVEVVLAEPTEEKPKLKLALLELIGDTRKPTPEDISVDEDLLIASKDSVK